MSNKDQLVHSIYQLCLAQLEDVAAFTYDFTSDVTHIITRFFASQKKALCTRFWKLLNLRIRENSAQHSMGIINFLMGGTMCQKCAIWFKILVMWFCSLYSISNLQQAFPEVAALLWAQMKLRAGEEVCLMLWMYLHRRKITTTSAIRSCGCS